MRTLSPILLLLVLPVIVTAQFFNNFRSYTTKDGLPTNFIYTACTDDKGFLWIATDAGLVRFDGQHFVNYTTAQGLPDVEILNLAKDKNGTLWANPFRNRATYFNEKRNWFVDEKQDTFLTGIKGNGIQRLVPLSTGGVAYINEKGIFVSASREKLSYHMSGSIETIMPYDSSRFILCTQSTIYLADKKGLKDSLQVGIYESDLVKSGNDGSLYLCSRKNRLLDVVSGIDFKNKKYNSKRFTIPDAPHQFSITRHFICVGTMGGTIYLLDKKDLSVVQIIERSLMMNAAFEDEYGQLWICTTEQGLIKASGNRINKLPVPDFFTNTHFISIAADSAGNILAGNRNGEIIITDGKKFEVKHLPSSQFLNWQRKLILHRQHLYSISEGGCFVDFTTPIDGSAGMKTAAFLNDSMLFLGGYYASKIYNTRNHTMEMVYKGKRITSLLITHAGKVLLGSIDGLYEWVQKDSLRSFTDKSLLLHHRITGLSEGMQGTIWISTASDGVLVLDSNYNMLQHITEKDRLASDLTRSIFISRSTAWVSTNSGISKVKYAYSAGRLQYSVINLSNANDLLTGTVQEMMVVNDTVYAAASNGIIYFPVDIDAKEAQPHITLTGFSVNGIDTILQKQYSFPYNYTNILLHFATADITGTEYSFQYRINNGNWISSTTGDINLQLSDGTYIIQIRAVNSDGKVTNDPASVEVTIRPAFWQTRWFFISIILFVFAGLLYFIQRQNRAKREKSLQAIKARQELLEIEMQAIRAQINPHFVFNCLNSIKSLHYQGRTHEADLYTDRFSLLLRSTLEYASRKHITLAQELEYAENYIRLEQLRFGDRLSYKITTAQDVDTAVIEVPPLLLQPYIENAIRHGIGNMEAAPGILLINIFRADNRLEISIRDNGVGREKAGDINAVRYPAHHSRGTQIAKKKEELYGIVSEITDLIKEDLSPAGTHVLLKFPLS